MEPMSGARIWSGDLARRSTVDGTSPSAILPLVAALLLLGVGRQQSSELSQFAALLQHLAALTAAAAPLILAHVIGSKAPQRGAVLTWAATFTVYPFAAHLLNSPHLLSTIEWIVVGIASATSLFLEQRSRTNILASLRRLPLTLDGVALVLWALWTIAASSLFIATPDPVENQPLDVWFDGQRIVDHPLLFASYLGQFALAAGMVFGFYWLCRHLLVRRVLAERGWISFFAGSLILWLLYTPIACSIVLLMPLNTADWSLIPSETANPFLPANYRFAAMVWVVVCPIVLASERLLALVDAADTRHARVRAELQLLQQQVNPHFLFNTLNTLYALCLSDNAASAQAIVKLSDLLRYSIYEAESDWVPLEGEIAHLRNYLELQLLRFNGNCRIEGRFPESLDGACVPPQMLIMLVENMFKHGVERSLEPVNISLDLSIVEGRMQFCCVNSPHDPATAPVSPGLGLINLRRRLELLCNDDFDLDSGPTPGSWTARLALKVRTC